jgi:hypothetical protein
MLTLYVVFAWLVGICYGFVLISSAAGHADVNLFQVGQVAVYKLHSTVLLNEIGNGAKNVGFFIAGDVMVHSVWAGGDDRILKLEVKGHGSIGAKFAKFVVVEGAAAAHSLEEGAVARRIYRTFLQTGDLLAEAVLYHLEAREGGQGFAPQWRTQTVGESQERDREFVPGMGGLLGLSARVLLVASPTIEESYLHLLMIYFAELSLT